ncbi:DUF2723 domain-containing protein [Balneola sp. MJW-20]|uniref:glycosyltransferase family 117 protein n=1 Tax=Gracilimonas aurantiaca TaxID=3234185 RepID=UPI00346750AE
MFSDHKSTNRYLALITFLVSLAVYVLTMAPTASFWDAGEFIAVANGLQVNHPPGAPFYSLLGRIFSMFVPDAYVAVSINLISAIASALTVMLLYLIIVRLVREWKGDMSDYTSMDKIGMYGGALVGALTFAVTDTFWFNAVEAEVYALSMFFTAIVVWLALKWAENHDKPYSEKWLVMIAYMFGLAIGVHLLNLLTLFFVALIMYFKKKDFEWKSFLTMGIIAVISFFIIYPFTIQSIHSIGSFVESSTYGLIGQITFLFLFALAVGVGIWYTQKNKMRIANIALISYMMILIGYSSYSVIMIRSIADPPIDENDPETVEAFIKYLKREQYGSTPILKGYNFDASISNINRNEEEYFPRRYSPDPNHLNFYSQYDSDWDYFWDYQVNHMYIRYFNWNFIGRVSDIQDTGWQAGFGDSPYANNPANNSFFYIPFILGIFGMIFHFSSDWKRALSVLALFIVTGLAIIIFLNQPPYQPRERDYAYVGSFFAFSIWIGLGVTGIVELIQSYLKDQKVLAYGAVVLSLLASPVLMGSQNWDDHDRSDRYIAPDYAYNLLISVAPNSILFTNGDNDTFPLWYLQEVEGIRTDVRIVCLSLLNTDWYIKQLRDQWSHESSPLPIVLSDDQVEQITSGLTRWEPQEIVIPVDKDMLKDAFSTESVYKELTGVKPDTSVSIVTKGIDFEMPVDSLDNEVRWNFQGRLYGKDSQGNNVYYLQTQDRLILEILRSNNWLRPVYFANTVSGNSQLNLNDYFRIEGKAYRVIPKRMEREFQGHIDPSIHADRLSKFRFRGWNNPDLYLDENIRRMVSNYRFNFMQIAQTYMDEGKQDSAAYWLKYGEENIPFRSYNDDHTIKLLYAVRYMQAGLADDASRLTQTTLEGLERGLSDQSDRFNQIRIEFTRLNDEFDQARADRRMEDQRRIRTQQESMIPRIESLQRELVQSRQAFIIAQNILFRTGNTDEAIALADKVDSLLGPQFPAMPTDEQQNMAEYNQYGL